MLVLDRQACRTMNKILEEHLTDVALNSMLKTRCNYPARLEQIVAKYLLAKTLTIIEFNNQESCNLCYCHKLSACAPYFYSEAFYACEVCQMCTDYCPEVQFDNNFRSFLKLIKDVSSRVNNIFQNIDLNVNLNNLKCKYHFTYYHENSLDYLIDEHKLFIY